jgi:hypothetical protein
MSNLSAAAQTRAVTSIELKLPYSDRWQASHNQRSQAPEEV